MSIEIPMQPERHYVEEAKGQLDDDAPWEEIAELAWELRLAEDYDIEDGGTLAWVDPRYAPGFTARADQSRAQEAEWFALQKPLIRARCD